MADTEERFSKARLEAFSDGVIAVIITIMVLDLKAPESAEPAALLKLWPGFAIYLVSFVFVAIYWINHHNLLTARAHRQRAPDLGQQRAPVLPVADPLCDRLCGGDRHGARSRRWSTARSSSSAPFPITCWSRLSGLGPARRRRFHGPLPGAPAAGLRRARGLCRRGRARVRQPDRGARPLRSDHALLCRAGPVAGAATRPRAR